MKEKIKERIVEVDLMKAELVKVGDSTIDTIEQERQHYVTLLNYEKKVQADLADKYPGSQLVLRKEV